MTVAYITGDREALLSIFSDPDKFSAAAPFTYLMASLIVLIFGSGLFSLDAFIERLWPSLFSSSGSSSSPTPTQGERTVAR